MPPRIPLPDDDELTPEHREMLDKVPPLNVFRMVAGTRRGFRPFLQLGGAVLSSSMDARRREIAVLRVAHVTGAGYEWAQREPEVILLVSYYNMVSRFLESTRVELEDEPPVGWQALGSAAQPPEQGSEG